MYSKNAAQSLFFTLVSASDGSALTGATVSATVSIDDAASAAATGTVTELGGGRYRFDGVAADWNGDEIGFQFTATGAIPVNYTLRTSAGLVALVATATRTELATELARIDVAVSTRATAASITSLGQVASYNNADASLRYITRGDAYDGTANAALTWDVTKDYTSGWTGTMTIRHRVTGASLMTATVTAASATQLTASLTTTNTAFALLVSDEEFGPHPYDIQMVNGSSEISAVPKGIAIISKDRSTS